MRDKQRSKAVSADFTKHYFYSTGFQKELDCRCQQLPTHNTQVSYTVLHSPVLSRAPQLTCLRLATGNLFLRRQLTSELMKWPYSKLLISVFSNIKKVVND